MTTGTLKEKATGTQGMFDLQSPSKKHRDTNDDRDTGNINDDHDTQREITDRNTNDYRDKNDDRDTGNINDDQDTQREITDRNTNDDRDTKDDRDTGKQQQRERRGVQGDI